MFGVLYIATGERCCAEAFLNAQRCRYVDPNVSITLKTDIPDYPGLAEVFDSVITFDAPSHSYRDKVSGLLQLPYKKTLFLDSDAFLIAPSDKLFEVLDASDLAASHAPVRHPSGWVDPAVPKFFSELNTGVLVLRRSKLVNELLAAWLVLYDELLISFGQSWDQASFRSVLWSWLSQKDLKFLHLPPEANLRTTKPWFAGRGLQVHVVHGRFAPEEFAPFVEFLNHDIDRFRTWDQWVQLNPETTIRPRYDRTFG